MTATSIMSAQNNKQAQKHFENGRKAYLKFTTEDYNEALGHFEKAISADPNYAAAYAGFSETSSLLGFEMEKSGQTPDAYYSKALQNAQKAIEKDSMLAMGHRALAQACINADPKKFGQLIYNELSRALELDSLDAETNYLMWLHTDNDNAASPWIKRSLAANDNFFQSHYGLSLLLAKQKNFEEAIVHYKKCIEINPKHHRPYFSLGNVYSQQKRYNLAIPQYESSLKINDKNTDAYFYLGLAYYYQDQNKNAKKYLQKYLEMAPSSAFRAQVQDILNEIQ
jgi:tetratricopeptide (TPR) repeat protein